MAASGGNPPDWRFFQVFGEEQPEGTGVEDIQEGVLPVHSVARLGQGAAVPSTWLGRIRASDGT